MRNAEAPLYAKADNKMSTFNESLRVLDMECPPGCKACEEVCARQACGNGSGSATITALHLPEAEYHRAMTCRQCGEPACEEACPVGAITKSLADGVVRIDQDKCVGCGQCAMECPYGGIYLDAEAGKSHKCDTCNGEFKCASACKYGVLSVLRNRETFAYSRSTIQ